jgi:hypothetical protein
MWWGVDSTLPITAAALDNVRNWYRGSPRPLAWGRYLSGPFGLRQGELAFARAHGIAVYVIVPDLDCSVCAGGGDLCGSDRTPAQAADDARHAVHVALGLGLPTGATLFKDIEQIGSCSGELTPEYLRAWYRYVLATRYRVAFYGNTFRQSWDFPRAYCAAVRADRQFASDVVLAQNEPEPAIGAARGRIGPANAPRFAPYVPRCAPRGVTRIWQYGESLTGENYTDVDEVVSGTHGLLAPDGSVT